MAAAIAPNPVKRPAAWAAVLILVLLPVGRVGWLYLRWHRFDPRFARAATALMISMAASALVALLAR